MPKKPPGLKKQPAVPSPTGALSSQQKESDAVRLANEAIRRAEVEIAKGKRTGQGIGSVRTPGGARKK